MSCDQCLGIEEQFDEGQAAQDLRRYRHEGPNATTRILLDALLTEGAGGKSLLDIGGGVGAIQLEFLERGSSHVTAVDASSAYERAADREAERQGFGGVVERHQGDFVKLASGIAPADIVTLDRVLCCFDDMRSLVQLSAARARLLYGLVYPRDEWWMRVFGQVVNGLQRLRRSQFRIFVHSTSAVETLVRESGFRLRFLRKTLIWRVVVFSREIGSPKTP